MAVSNSDRVLDDDQLNDLDRAILQYLDNEGRATPRVIQQALESRGQNPGVRQNVNSRLTRLAEHGHLKNVYDAGLYELIDDPRDDPQDELIIIQDGGDVPDDDSMFPVQCACGLKIMTAEDAHEHLYECEEINSE